MSNLITLTVYAAVRSDRGREFTLANEVAATREIAEEVAAQSEKRSGKGWAGANRVVRIGSFTLTEGGCS